MLRASSSGPDFSLPNTSSSWHLFPSFILTTENGLFISVASNARQRKEREKSQLTWYQNNKHRKTKKMPSKLMTFFSLLCLQDHIFLTVPRANQRFQALPLEPTCRAATHSFYPAGSFGVTVLKSGSLYLLSPNVHSSLQPSKHVQTAYQLLAQTP